MLPAVLRRHFRAIMSLAGVRADARDASMFGRFLSLDTALRRVDFALRESNASCPVFG